MLSILTGSVIRVIQLSGNGKGFVRSQNMWIGSVISTVRLCGLT